MPLEGAAGEQGVARRAAAPGGGRREARARGTPVAAAGHALVAGHVGGGAVVPADAGTAAAVPEGAAPPLARAVAVAAAAVRAAESRRLLADLPAGAHALETQGGARHAACRAVRNIRVLIRLEALKLVDSADVSLRDSTKVTGSDFGLWLQDLHVDAQEGGERHVHALDDLPDGAGRERDARTLCAEGRVDPVPALHLAHQAAAIETGIFLPR
mmetsp:Transcript_82828/g.261627  ORF Transcript_82828/g.261627 Transcript_82828/m.261627 type:complete len:214 (+) Transcript_82828:1211-1852(+)